MLGKAPAPHRPLLRTPFGYKRRNPDGIGECAWSPNGQWLVCRRSIAGTCDTVVIDAQSESYTLRPLQLDCDASRAFADDSLLVYRQFGRLFVMDVAAPVPSPTEFHPQALEFDWDVGTGRVASGSPCELGGTGSCVTLLNTAPFTKLPIQPQFGDPKWSPDGSHLSVWNPVTERRGLYFHLAGERRSRSTRPETSRTFGPRTRAGSSSRKPPF